MIESLVKQKNETADSLDNAVYFTTEQGKIMSHKAPMAADKSIRSDLVDKFNVYQPAPGMYKIQDP